MPNYTNSVWSEATPAPPYEPLAGNVAVDVAVVGGGITGITAALLLARAGRRVAVIEARRIGKGETGKTTAHLTEVLDVPFHALVSINFPTYADDEVPAELAAIPAIKPGSRK